MHTYFKWSWHYFISLMFPLRIILLVSSLVNVDETSTTNLRSAFECFAFIWMPKHLLISVGAIQKGSELCM